MKSNETEQLKEDSSCTDGEKRVMGELGGKAGYWNHIFIVLILVRFSSEDSST